MSDREPTKLTPLVSVIIPTCNRPQLIERAVNSALAQTLKNIEVIVVIDGPDEKTSHRLSKIEDSRLRVIELATNGGAPIARNTAASEAKGEWVALLDDDDEWLPQKLEKQIEIAQKSNYPLPIISSRLIARTPRGDFIWPRREPQASESIVDYRFLRKSFFRGESLLLTSTLLTKRELMQKVPFKVGLHKNQDGDWVLRATSLPEVGVEFIPEALAIWHTEQSRDTISGINDWQHTLDWIRESRPLLSPQAYASTILVYAGSEASKQGNWQAFFPLLWEAMVKGRITPIPLLVYLVNWIIPQNSRRWIRAFLTKIKKNNRL